MELLLAVDEVHAGYGAGDVLRGVNLTVRAGEIVCLIGPNRAGATGPPGGVRVDRLAGQGRPDRAAGRAERPVRTGHRGPGRGTCRRGGAAHRFGRGTAGRSRSGPPLPGHRRTYRPGEFRRT